MSILEHATARAQRRHLIEVCLLGPVTVRDVGGDVVGLGGLKPRAVLALLALRSPDVVHRDEIIGELWPDLSENSARSSLHSYVSRLRTALGGQTSEVIRTWDAGYSFVENSVTIDAVSFREVAHHREQEEVSLDDILSALMMWRGPALVDIHDLSPGLGAYARSLNEERVALAISTRQMQLNDEQARRAAAVIAPLSRMTRLDEDLWLTAAALLIDAGLTSAALRLIGEAEQAISSELEVDPSPRFDELRGKATKRSPPPMIASRRGAVSLECERLHAELSVFSGSSSLTAARAVSSLPIMTVEPCLKLLSDQGVIEYGPGRDGERFVLRRHQVPGLSDVDLAETTTRHALFYTRWAESSFEILLGPQWSHVAEAWDLDYENILAASTTHLRTGRISLFQRTIAALTSYWWRRQLHEHARRWLPQAIGHPTIELDDYTVGLLHFYSAFFSIRIAPHDESSLVHLDQAVTAFDRSGRQSMLLHALGWLAIRAEDEAHINQIREIGVRAGDQWAISWGHFAAAMLALRTGQYLRAQAEFRASFETGRSVNSVMDNAILLLRWADADTQLNDRSSAITHLEEARSLFEIEGTPGFIRGVRERLMAARELR